MISGLHFGMQAKRTSESFAQPEFNGQLLCRPGPLLRSSGPESNSHAVGKSTDSQTGAFGVQSRDGKVASANESGEDGVSGENRVSRPVQSRRNEPVIDPAVQCGTVGDYLEASPAHALEESSPKDTGGDPGGPRPDHTELTGDSEQAISSGERSTGRLSDDDDDDDDDQWQPYHVPMSVVERWIDAYGILSFTSNYSALYSCTEKNLEGKQFPLCLNSLFPFGIFLTFSEKTLKNIECKLLQHESALHCFRLVHF